jgi:hypothetical protein
MSTRIAESQGIGINAGVKAASGIFNRKVAKPNKKWREGSDLSPPLKNSFAFLALNASRGQTPSFHSKLLRLPRLCGKE